MTDVVPTTPGLYPLPDPAKDELADLKGHQKDDLIDGTEDGAVVEVYEGARTDVVERQREAGLGRIVEGQLRWDDMLAHPLTIHDAVETRGIVRYYDNNNFYREPVVTGALDFDGDIAGELETAAELVEDGLQAVVPGPYSLANLATDEHYGDDGAFLSAVADFLAGEVAAFPGVETVFVLEPSLVTHPPEGDDGEAAGEAIDAVAGATDADVVVHTYWGGFDETVHAHLLDADIEAVGYDVVNALEESIYTINEYGTADDIALGVVDGQNTQVESSHAIRERVEYVLDNTRGAAPDTVYVTSNTELFYLPVTKFEAKLDALAQAGREEVRA